MPPISLDSTLANVPGSKGEETLNVSEIGRAGPGEQPRKAGRSAEAVERAAGAELMRTRAKLGEMTMRVELQAELLEKGGTGTSFGSS